MRILHTSDWHLGQSLHQYDRLYEHDRFLHWLIDTIESQSVDALLIAGDIFDNANPSAAAQKQLYRFLAETRRRVPHLNIVMTAGNHDSPSRLEAPSPLLEVLKATVVGQVAKVGEKILWEKLIVPLKDRHGVTKAWCIAMPFLRPSDTPRGERAGNPYSQGMAAAYGQALAYALSQRQAGQAILAIGHCHLSGGQTSQDSERQIVIGGEEALPLDIFDPAIAYVALGHLHLAQAVGGNASRRYCGSPIPLSFSEVHYPHQVVLVDLDGENLTDIRELRVPRFVEILNVPRSPAPLQTTLAELAALNLPNRPEQEWPYLQVRVQLSQPEPDLRAQIEKALAQKPVRLAKIEVSRPRTKAESQPSAAASIDEFNSLAAGDFFQRLYQQQYAEMPPPELLAAFNELLNSPSETEPSQP